VERQIFDFCDQRLYPTFLPKFLLYHAKVFGILFAFFAIFFIAKFIYSFRKMSFIEQFRLKMSQLAEYNNDPLYSKKDIYFEIVFLIKRVLSYYFDKDFLAKTDEELAEELNSLDLNQDPETIKEFRELLDTAYKVKYFSADRSNQATVADLEWVLFFGEKLVQQKLKKV